MIEVTHIIKHDYKKQIYFRRGRIEVKLNNVFLDFIVYQYKDEGNFFLESNFLANDELCDAIWFENITGKQRNKYTKTMIKAFRNNTGF